MEVDSVWPGEVTGTKIIYLFNRYAFGIAMLLQTICVLPGSTSQTGYVIHDTSVLKSS